MKRFIFVAVFFFLFTPAAFAVSCGDGGTCKANCSFNDRGTSASGNFSCLNTSSGGVATPKCCLPSNCPAPGACQPGPTTANPNLNTDPNVSCGSVDKCYMPSTFTSTTGTTNQPNGAGCLKSSECTSNYCDTSVGVCKTNPAANTTNQPNGALCRSSTECTSGYCNTTLISPVCQTRPSTGTAPTQPGGGSTVGSPTQPGGNNIPSTGENITLINPLQGGGSLENFLLSILAFVIRIGSIVVVLMLVYVGYLFVIARGEPGKLTEARQALLWTVVGALILLGSQAIALGIKATVQALSVGQ